MRKKERKREKETERQKETEEKKRMTLMTSLIFCRSLHA